MSNEEHIIKILKGTIVKYDGHPIRLAESILININEDDFKLEKHKILFEKDLKKNDEKENIITRNENSDNTKN